MHLHYRLSRVHHWRPFSVCTTDPSFRKSPLLTVQVRHSPRQHRCELELMRRPFDRANSAIALTKNGRSDSSSGTFDGGTILWAAAAAITRTASDALSIRALRRLI
jgi:hypothetical protein